MSSSCSSEVDRWTAGVLGALAVLTEKEEGDIVEREEVKGIRVGVG